MFRTKSKYEGTKFNKATMYEMAIFSELASKDGVGVSDDLSGTGFTLTKFIDLKKTDTQAFIVSSKDNIVIFYRGTKDRQDIKTDLNFIKDSAPSNKKGEEIHRGFKRAYDSVKSQVAAEVKKLHKGSKRKVWVTGHSLGAALAGITVYDLEKNQGIIISGIYNFGQPRFSNKSFAKTYDKIFKSRTFRIVNNNDIVARIPLRAMGYQHTGTLYYFDRHGNLKKGYTWWQEFIDRLFGKFDDAFDGDIDFIADHNMKTYLRLSWKALN